MKFIHKEGNFSRSRALVITAIVFAAARRFAWLHIR